MKKTVHLKWGYYSTTLYQLVVAVVMLWLTRFAFYIGNADSIGSVSASEWVLILFGGFRFDLCAVAYFNIPFILMRFIPLGFVTNRRWLIASNIVYGICNGIMLALNIVDVAFSPFIGGRMRWATLTGMLGDPDIGRILLSCFPGYWWAFLIAIAVIGVTLTMACVPSIAGPIVTVKSRIRSVLLRTLIFVVVGCATFMAIKGRVSGRPLNIADAVYYASNSKMPLVLNTPFSVLRSITTKDDLIRVSYFAPEIMRRLSGSRHDFTKADALPDIQCQRGKNIVVIVIESGAQLWIDTLNIVKNDPKRGLTPFLDSIASHSMVCRNVMATGVTSPNGITAIFCGFPSFEPMLHMVSPYSANILDTPVNLLVKEGYSSKFYFGGSPASYYIVQSALASGFKDAATRNDYGNNDDFDGKWGIFDHAMGAYAACDMSSLPRPFFAGWFTLSSHIPFTTPENWQSGGYKSRPRTPQRGIEYADRALRHFFNVAKEQPWYDNTLFIITGDHGCREMRSLKYNSPYIKYHIPLIFYTPDGSLPIGEVGGRVMSQFDISPTLLRLMGYDKPFISVGTDLFDSSRPHYAISMVDGRFMITGNRYVVMADRIAFSVDAVYDVSIDQRLANPLTDYDYSEVDSMMLWAKAFLQDYTWRMLDNRMSIATDSEHQGG